MIQFPFFLRFYFVIIFLTGYLGAESLTLRGITEPFQYSTISSTVAGRVAVINREEGEAVKKGVVILELEKEEEELETARRKLIAESNAELVSAQHQVNTGKLDYEATKKLFESTHSVSEEEVWKKDLAYKLAVAEYDRLGVAKKREEMEYRIAQAQLSKRIIRAPFDGVVVKIFLKAGESCNAQEPLVRVIDAHKCRFITYVEATASQGLIAGKNVPLTIEGGGNVQGFVEFVSPEVDPSSGLRKIKIVFNNPDGKIQPGLKGTLIITDKP